MTRVPWGELGQNQQQQQPKFDFPSNSECSGEIKRNEPNVSPSCLAGGWAVIDRCVCVPLRAGCAETETEIDR